MGAIFSIFRKKKTTTTQPSTQPTTTKSKISSTPICITNPDTSFYNLFGILNLPSILENGTLLEYFTPFTIDNINAFVSKNNLKNPYYWIYTLKPNNDPVFSTVTTNKGWDNGTQTTCNPASLYPQYIYVPVNEPEVIDFCKNADWRERFPIMPLQDEATCTKYILNNNKKVIPIVPCAYTLKPSARPIIKNADGNFNVISTVVNKSDFKPGYKDTNCAFDKKNPEVYQIQGAFTQTQAAAACAANGGVLATPDQVTQGWREGANWSLSHTSVNPLSPQQTTTNYKGPAILTDSTKTTSSALPATCYGIKPPEGKSGISYFNGTQWNAPRGTNAYSTSWVNVPTPTSNYCATQDYLTALNYQNSEACVLDRMANNNVLDPINCVTTTATTPYTYVLDTSDNTWKGLKKKTKTGIEYNTICDMSDVKELASVSVQNLSEIKDTYCPTFYNRTNRAGATFSSATDCTSKILNDPTLNKTPPLVDCVKTSAATPYNYVLDTDGLWKGLRQQTKTQPEYKTSCDLSDIKDLASLTVSNLSEIKDTFCPNWWNRVNSSGITFSSPTDCTNKILNTLNKTVPSVQCVTTVAPTPYTYVLDSTDGKWKGLKKKAKSMLEYNSVCDMSDVKEDAALTVANLAEIRDTFCPGWWNRPNSAAVTFTSANDCTSKVINTLAKVVPTVACVTSIAATPYKYIQAANGQYMGVRAVTVSNPPYPTSTVCNTADDVTQLASVSVPNLQAIVTFATNLWNDSRLKSSKGVAYTSSSDCVLDILNNRNKVIPAGITQNVTTTIGACTYDSTTTNTKGGMQVTNYAYTQGWDYTNNVYLQPTTSASSAQCDPCANGSCPGGSVATISTYCSNFYSRAGYATPLACATDLINNKKAIPSTPVIINPSTTDTCVYASSTSTTISGTQNKTTTYGPGWVNNAVSAPGPSVVAQSCDPCAGNTCSGVGSATIATYCSNFYSRAGYGSAAACAKDMVNTKKAIPSTPSLAYPSTLDTCVYSSSTPTAVIGTQNKITTYGPGWLNNAVSNPSPTYTPQPCDPCAGNTCSGLGSATVATYCSTFYSRAGYGSAAACVQAIVNNKKAIPSTPVITNAPTTDTCVYNASSPLKGTQNATTTYGPGWVNNAVVTPGPTTVNQNCDPCAPFSAGSTVNADCYKKLWSDAGCTTDPISLSGQWEWARYQSRSTLQSDNAAWASIQDQSHVDGCYGAGTYKYPRPDVGDIGYGDQAGRIPRGWYDILGQGVANDYCRYVGNNDPDTDWACHLSGKSQNATSKYGNPTVYANTYNGVDLKKHPAVPCAISGQVKDGAGNCAWPPCPYNANTPYGMERDSNGNCACPADKPYTMSCWGEWPFCADEWSYTNQYYACN